VTAIPESETPRSAAPRVLVTRAAEQADEIVQALREVGLDPVPVPAIAVDMDLPHGDLDAAVARIDTYAWVVVTSANGARAIIGAAERATSGLGAPRWAAIGPATRRDLDRDGVEVAFQPNQSSGAAMGAELPVVAGERVLVVRGDLADAELPAVLQARGAVVDDVVAYRTREAPASSRRLLREAMARGAVAAVVFTSGSTVRGLVALAFAESIDVLSIPSACIGPDTADAARAAGFEVLAVSPTPDPAALAAATAGALVLQPQEIR